MDVSKELLENYDGLRRSRGWSWDLMADSVERTDPETAAELRKQHKASRGTADAGRKTPPQGRSAPSKPSAAH